MLNPIEVFVLKRRDKIWVQNEVRNKRRPFPSIHRSI